MKGSARGNWSLHTLALLSTCAATSPLTVGCHSVLYADRMAAQEGHDDGVVAQVDSALSAMQVNSNEVGYDAGNQCWKLSYEFLIRSSPGNSPLNPRVRRVLELFLRMLQLSAEPVQIKIVDRSARALRHISPRPDFDGVLQDMLAIANGCRVASVLIRLGVPRDRIQVHDPLMLCQNSSHGKCIRSLRERWLEISFVRSSGPR